MTQVDDGAFLAAACTTTHFAADDVDKLEKLLVRVDNALELIVSFFLFWVRCFFFFCWFGMYC